MEQFEKRTLADRVVRNEYAKTFGIQTQSSSAKTFKMSIQRTKSLLHTFKRGVSVWRSHLGDYERGLEVKTVEDEATVSKPTGVYEDKSLVTYEEMKTWLDRYSNAKEGLAYFWRTSNFKTYPDYDSALGEMRFDLKGIESGDSVGKMQEAL